jgi:hypothetical protein
MNSLSHAQSLDLHIENIAETSPTLVILRKGFVKQLDGFPGLRRMVDKVVVEEMGLEVVVTEAEVVLDGKGDTC